MRILYLSPCGQLGGAERCLLDVLASLRRSEPTWQLYLIAGEDGSLLSEARRLGVHAQVVCYPQRLAKMGSFGTNLFRLAAGISRTVPETLKYVRAFRREIERIGPDLIHTNGFKMHVLGAAVGAVPVIWHLHDYLAARSVNTGLLRLLSRKCSGAIAISSSVARDAIQCLPDYVPVETVLNAVDLMRFQPHGERLNLDALAGRLEAAGRPVRVGLVGTFAKWKGHDVFLRALAQPELQNIDLRAYIVGGPIYQTSNGQHSIVELRTLARNLGLNERVGFTGFVSDTAAAIRALDIVVHASTAPEPFGLVIAEAMACGKAVIASQSGGASELFTDGYDAIGVDPGDPQSLARAMHRLALDPIARLRMGRAARITAEVRFNWARLGPELSSFYRQITCESSTSTAAISTAA